MKFGRLILSKIVKTVTPWGAYSAPQTS